MIGLLLRFRYQTAALTTALLIVLVFYGKKVSYEQSIGSFFADDDPYMAVYQKAASSFGDDNFVFLAYDDPKLISPRGVDRVAELAAAVAPDRIAGVMRVESLDAMPLVWSLDDILIALDRLPALARNVALSTARRTIKNVDLENQCADGRRSGTGRRPLSAGDSQGSLEPSSLVPGHIDRRDGHDHGCRGAAAQDTRAQCDRDDQDVACRGRSVCGKARAGPSRGGWATRSAGRWLRGHRGGRPPARGCGHAFDRSGNALGSAQRLVGHRTHDRGLDDLAGDRNAALRFPHQAVAIGGSPGRADHRADDACGQPPGHPFSRRPPPRGRSRHRRPVDPARRRRADHLDGDHRGHRLWRTGHQQPGAGAAIRGDPGNLHALFGDPGHGHLTDRDDAARSRWRSPCARALAPGLVPR